MKGRVIAQLFCILGLLAMDAGWATAVPLSTAFTYQGQIQQNGSPIGTQSCDVQFGLFAAVGGGAALATQQASGVQVTNGLFTAPLDFGSSAFAGEDRYLELSVRCPAGTGSFSAPLSPRQKLTAEPYALYATNAGSVPWSGLTGLSCSSGQIARWNGSAWTCAAESGATYTAGSGLSLSGNTFSIANGGVTSTMIAPGTSLPPSGAAGGGLSGSYPNPSIATGGVGTSQLSASGSSNGQVLTSNGSQVVWQTPSGATYTAGSGLALSGTTFSIAPGGVTSTMIAPGTALPPNGAAGGSLNGSYPNPGIAAGAIGNTQLAVNYAGSSSQGGPASDVSCTSCVSNGEMSAGGSSIGQVLTSNGSQVVWQTPSGMYTAGTGLTLNGSQFNVNTAAIQARVSSSCPASSAIRAIDVNGAVGCENFPAATYGANTATSVRPAADGHLVVLPVTVPGPGSVLVSAHWGAGMRGNGTQDCSVWTQISDAPSTSFFGGPGFSRFFLPSNLPTAGPSTGYLTLPGSATRLFSVGGPGTVNYYLNGRAVTCQDFLWVDIQMSAQYFPQGSIVTLNP